jgi:hypothetical protein
MRIPSSREKKVIWVNNGISSLTAVVILGKKSELEYWFDGFCISHLFCYFKNLAMLLQYRCNKIFCMALIKTIMNSAVR